ncbi:hypothetical protein ACFYXM_29270 [Streptomyces sp. NPDC002476]|uniref:hypothetical protein n=1 Tax=Streptomyces sp. NPDC002476 TaxID=3364648 RepID=UPI0036971585
MTIQVTGSDWDAAVLRALDGHPPPMTRRGERHRHVLRLLIDVIGEDLKLFLRCHGAPYVARWRRSGDPVMAFVSWTADYYLCLHDVMRAGPGRAVPGWDDAVRAAGSLAGTARLLLTAQLGHALLLPLLVEEATGRPVYPVVHDRNPLVLRFYQERLRRGEPLSVTGLGSSDIRRWLRTDSVIVANVDTSYPGTRQRRSLPFLGGRLDVPVGLLTLASRRSLETRAMTVPDIGGHPSPRGSAPLPDDTERAVLAYGGCLERWVTAHPEQWMAWSSFTEQVDPVVVGGS